jgi:outer membrane receptor protein involved in Fe transport
VTPLVRARGGEVGARTFVAGRLQSSVTAWILDLDSELVFLGDAGTTEPSRPSRRLGVEWSSAWSASPWLTLDADVAWSKARFRDGDPVGDRVPGAVEGVASVGATLHDHGPLSASLRFRYFGPRPLLEDDSVRSKASATLNARVAYRAGDRVAVTLDVFNLTNSRVSDIDYFYTSRLPGEPAAGVDDVHTHPLAPFRARLSVTLSF